MTRLVKLSFRRKRGRRGTVEVYTGMRLPGIKHPQRKHVLYLVESDGDLAFLPNEDPTLVAAAVRIRSRVTEKSKAALKKWLGLDDVAVDFENAMGKWQRLGEGREAVDREAGASQIRAWISEGTGAPIAAFADAPTKAYESDRVEFGIKFLDSYQRIAGQLRGEDPLRIATWWEELEAPRLVHGFYRFVIRRHASEGGEGMPFFCRSDFLVYLGKRISMKLARNDYWRWRASRDL